MYGPTVIGAPRSQRRPAFESDQQVPYTIDLQSFELNEPTDAMVRHAVQGMFSNLPEEVQGDVRRVAMELIRNTQPLWRPQAGVVRPNSPAVILTLGWATDERNREWVKYPLIMVSDGNAAMPDVRDLTRTWLGLVIELTHRCGAFHTKSGKRYWALVSPDAR